MFLHSFSIFLKYRENGVKSWLVIKVWSQDSGTREEQDVGDKAFELIDEYDQRIDWRFGLQLIVAVSFQS